MTMTLSAATARLNREMAAAHTDVDQALRSVARLFHSTVLARTDLTEVDPSLGHAALLRMHKSAGDLLTVRTDMIRTHGALKDDLRIVSGAEELDCPLTIVGAEADPANTIAA